MITSIDDFACADAAHGNRCPCRLLAEVSRVRPESISWHYCQHVLMKHWAMTCNHVGRLPPAVVDSSGKWRDIGATDQVKAILIAGGQPARSCLDRHS